MFQVDQIGGLSTNKAWNSIDQAQFLAHFEAFVKCTDITKIAIRNNDPIGDSQSNCCRISIVAVFCPSILKLFNEFAK